MTNSLRDSPKPIFIRTKRKTHASEREQSARRALSTKYIDASSSLKKEGITVVVQNGLVRLTGTVPTGAQRLEAAVVARAIPGVRAVQDDLRLATAPN
jgi:osmotically-inducible protein OsmY